MFNTKIVALFLSFFALIVLFLPSSVPGHNEDQSPEHSHVTEYRTWTSTFWPPEIHERRDGDCVTITYEAFFVATVTTQCTHGIPQPPPPRHPDPCGCAATNCGYDSCGCSWGSHNGGLSECPCESPCPSS